MNNNEFEYKNIFKKITSKNKVTKIFFSDIFQTILMLAVVIVDTIYIEYQKPSFIIWILGRLFYWGYTVFYAVFYVAPFINRKVK